MNKNKYRVITLCGSTSFKKEHTEVQERLTLEGNIVIPIAPFWRGECRDLAPELKSLFFNMHCQKIEMSDAIYVVNPNGYIGETTRAEIEYAQKCNKEIFYLESPEVEKKRKKKKKI